MKHLPLTATILLGILALTGCDNGRVTELESQVATLTKERDALKEEAETLESEKQELEDKILTLQSAVEDMHLKFNRLEMSVSEFRGGASNWRDVVDDVELDLDRVGSGLDDVEGEFP